MFCKDEYPIKKSIILFALEFARMLWVLNLHL